MAKAHRFTHKQLGRIFGESGPKLAKEHQPTPDAPESASQQPRGLSPEVRQATVGDKPKTEKELKRLETLNKLLREINTAKETAENIAKTLNAGIWRRRDRGRNLLLMPQVKDLSPETKSQIDKLVKTTGKIESQIRKLFTEKAYEEISGIYRYENVRKLWNNIKSDGELELCVKDNPNTPCGVVDRVSKFLAKAGELIERELPHPDPSHDVPAPGVSDTGDQHKTDRPLWELAFGSEGSGTESQHTPQKDPWANLSDFE
jgi:hypothetical protein